MKSLTNWWFFLGLGSLFVSFWQTLASPQNPKDALDIAKDYSIMPRDLKENEPPFHRLPPAISRLKRQTSSDGNDDYNNQDSGEYYDENSDGIIPELGDSDGRHFGQNLQNALTKLSESMKNMWNNLSATIEKIGQSISKAFNGDSPTSDYDINKMETE